MKPVLHYFGKFPPLAVLVAAEEAKIDLEVKEEPKYTKDTPPLLSLPAGYRPNSDQIN